MCFSTKAGHTAHFFELSQRGHARLVRHEILTRAHNLDGQACSIRIYASARHQGDIRIVEDANATIEAERLRIARGEIGCEIVLRREKAYERRARAEQCIHLAEDVIMVDADDGEADRHVGRALIQISRIPTLKRDRLLFWPPQQHAWNPKDAAGISQYVARKARCLLRVVTAAVLTETPMKRGLRAFAGAAGLLVVWLIAETASAQKSGGILQISHRDSPASTSTLEEVTF